MSKKFKKQKGFPMFIDLNQKLFDVDGEIMINGIDNRAFKQIVDVLISQGERELADKIITVISGGTPEDTCLYHILRNILPREDEDSKGENKGKNFDLLMDLRDHFKAKKKIKLDTNQIKILKDKINKFATTLIAGQVSKILEGEPNPCDPNIIEERQSKFPSDNENKENDGPQTE